MKSKIYLVFNEVDSDENKTQKVILKKHYIKDSQGEYIINENEDIQELIKKYKEIFNTKAFDICFNIENEFYKAKCKFLNYNCISIIDLQLHLMKLNLTPFNIQVKIPQEHNYNDFYKNIKKNIKKADKKIQRKVLHRLLAKNSMLV